MLKNYFKVALRNLRKQKGYAVINVLGLGLGLACSVLIALFVRHELSYDRFHDNADRIVRVTYEEVATPAMRHFATVSPPVAPTLAETYPEVRHAVRLREAHPSVIGVGEEQFYERAFFYADSSFFAVFDGFTLRAGDPATALAHVNTVVLTAETARKYFGDANPLGQTFVMNDEAELTVTGVLEPLPSTSHLNFDFLISFETFQVPHGYPVSLESWGWVSFHTYLLLAEDADAATLEARLPEFMQTHFDAERARTAQLRLQPLTDIYLGTPTHPAMATGTPTYLYGLGTVGVLILLLACFNFTNLATAHAIRRGKEVGVRKAIGAHRGQLVGQFLGESVLVALLGLGLAAVLVSLAASGSRSLVGWSPQIGDVLPLVLPAVALTIAAGLLAGSYPAFVLARFEPARGLKGETSGLFAQGTLRGALVVLQFSIAVALIAGSLIVSQQMRFVQEKELGFDREQVVALHVPGAELNNRYPELRAALLQNPDVLRVSRGGHLFDGDQGSVPIIPEGTGGEAVRAMSIYSLYYDFVETLGLEVVAGRAPSEAFASDSAAIMLNRSAAEVMATEVPGWENPIGKEVRVSDIMTGRVVGVVEDFHYASLHAEIEPLVLFFPRAFVDKVFVRVRPDAGENLLASLEETWARVAPDLPFRTTFLDDHVEHLYRADQRFARLTTLFTALTMLVAGLGLYGLVAFVTQLRTKEIGIRKVLGASVRGLVVLLSTRFLGYVLIANLIAWPLAYLAMDRWLDGFAYRVAIGPGAFALAGAAALVLALLALGTHTLRAATTDPVKALRTE